MNLPLVGDRRSWQEWEPSVSVCVRTSDMHPQALDPDNDEDDDGEESDDILEVCLRGRAGRSRRERSRVERLGQRGRPPWSWRCQSSWFLWRLKAPLRASAFCFVLSSQPQSSSAPWSQRYKWFCKQSVEKLGCQKVQLIVQFLPLFTISCSLQTRAHCRR